MYLIILISLIFVGRFYSVIFHFELMFCEILSVRILGLNYTPQQMIWGYYQVWTPLNYIFRLGFICFFSSKVTEVLWIQASNLCEVKLVMHSREDFSFPICISFTQNQGIDRHKDHHQTLRTCLFFLAHPLKIYTLRIQGLSWREWSLWSDLTTRYYLQCHLPRPQHTKFKIQPLS